MPHCLTLAEHPPDALLAVLRASLQAETLAALRLTCRSLRAAAEEATSQHDDAGAVLLRLREWPPPSAGLRAFSARCLRHVSLERCADYDGPVLEIVHLLPRVATLHLSHTAVMDV